MFFKTIIFGKMKANNEDFGDIYDIKRMEIINCGRW